MLMRLLCCRCKVDPNVFRQPPLLREEVRSWSTRSSWTRDGKAD